MQGILAHVSNPKRSTSCITTLNNIPNILGMSLSLPSILVVRYQIFRAFQKSPITANQSPSDTGMALPKYLKYVNDSIGLPLA